METTWKQAVYDIADAYREAEGTEDKISIANLKEKVRDGGGKVYLDGERIKQLEMTSYKGDDPLTIGASGATFDANVLLQNGLTIVNGVNGEDLTDVEARQALAVADLMRMALRKVSDHKGEGDYVWKKLTSQNGTFVDFVVNSDETAYPDGGTQDGYWYELVTNYTGSYTITPSAANQTIPANNLLNQILTIAGDSDLKAENIREGVDIWGILGTMSEGVDLLSLFGASKIAVDKLILTTSANTHSHSLGEIPDMFIMFAPINETIPSSGYPNTNKTLIYIGGRNIFKTTTQQGSYFMRFNKKYNTNGEKGFEFDGATTSEGTGSATAWTDTTVATPMSPATGIEYTLVTLKLA